jgi:uncharacterized protein YaaW (UPF0174 family)
MLAFVAGVFTIHCSCRRIPLVKMLSRREALMLSLGTFGGAAVVGSIWKFNQEPITETVAATEPPKPPKAPIAAVAPLVLPDAKWNANDLSEFVFAIPADGRLSMLKALKLEDENATEDVLKGRAVDVRAILTKLDKVYCSIFEYPFSDELTANYHEMVQWAARKGGVADDKVNSLSTFRLEREILLTLWGQMWEKLTKDQQLALLNTIETSKNVAIADKAAIVGTSGAAALAALGTTVYFAGFAFYSTMSVTLCTVAGFAGITLPFAAYSGASTIVAFLSGPVGWAIAAILAIGSLAWLLGKGNPNKTIAAIAQLHALKIAALIADGVPASQLFPQ